VGDHRGDGDGWVECARGHRHWGLFGAAGLLAHRGSDDGTAEVLLQHRAEWSHFGGTWGLLGGARQRGESAVTAAVREAGEEGGVAPGDVRVHGRYDEEHGGWSYATILGMARWDLDARPTGGESIDVAWHPADRVGDLPLHPGFAGAWPVLRAALRPLTVVVDAANVVGSRPDGWWRDRVGAAGRLIDAAGSLASRGVADGDIPRELARAPLTHWWPVVRVVVEGVARAVDTKGAAGVSVVAAPASGDDEIVEQAAAGVAAGQALVVTADRELRDRCRSAGAAVVGPRWWHDRTTVTT